MRYPMRLDRPWRPLLALFGGTRGQSYVDVSAGDVRFRFGWGFDLRVPRDLIERAEPSPWAWLHGIGWRLAPGGVVGLIGSTSGLVDVRLRRPQRVRLMAIPWTCRRIRVSLEDPEGFMAELRGPAG